MKHNFIISNTEFQFINYKTMKLYHLSKIITHGNINIILGRYIHSFNLANNFHVLLRQIYMSQIPIWNLVYAIELCEHTLTNKFLNFLGSFTVGVWSLGISIQRWTRKSRNNWRRDWVSRLGPTDRNEINRDFFQSGQAIKLPSGFKNCYPRRFNWRRLPTLDQGTSEII